LALVLSAAVLAVPLGSLLRARFAPSTPGRAEISEGLQSEFEEHLSVLLDLRYLASAATLREGTM